MYTRGRVGQALEHLLGVDELPVLLAGTRLAALVMWKSHEEDHKQLPRDTLARSRKRAWIVNGMRLAKWVSRQCPHCNITRAKEKKQLVEQLMADIPEHQLVPCPPFTNVSVDFMGPYKVRGLANQRARIKVYGCVFVCQNTRAVKLIPVPGYDTDSLMLAFINFTSNFSTPSLVVSDAGSQMKKTAKVVSENEEDFAKLNWDKISDTLAKSGTKWLAVPPGCQWRNGICERMVATLKRTLTNILQANESLNIA